jgi:hypothetical protein
MSDARDVLLAMALPDPAQRLLLASDDQRLVAELGTNYPHYHAHLQMRLTARNGRRQSLAAAKGAGVEGPPEDQRRMLTTFATDSRLMQDITDAERMLRRAAELANAGTTARTLDDVYRQDQVLPTTGADGELLSVDDGVREAGRLNDAAAAALLRPSASPMDAIAKLQQK